MKAVIQRVKYANVKVDGEIIGAIDGGFLVLLGVEETDTEKEAELLARKTANLRIFDDEEGKMNKSLGDFGYSVLVISQFTLIADCKKGNRPSFIRAAKPDTAIPLYEAYMEALKENGVEKVESGEFGADMKVELLNDGPVTIIFDTDEWK
ncbi:MAG: D-tyrosyl-tRNA(Tyr) deacylase [Ruminococcaceae bacterium]|nr:D-tyrosyl-tRNA(Tyr) deacylase [Oscillospiraceae bacterium]